MEPIDYTQARFGPDSDPQWCECEGQVASAGYYFWCVLFCWLIIPFFMGVARYLRVSKHTYTLTAQRLRVQRGLLFRRTEELELYRVKDISVDQPLLQRLAGCGRVMLETTDRSTPQIVLDAIPDPLAVADLIRDFVEQCRVAKGVREFN
jgi:membrane protein YdbS with pleckstrin-like domain